MSTAVPAHQQRIDREATGPLVSVVITSYTMDRFKDVQELLESLQAQTYPNIEIVFVGENHPELCKEVDSFAQAWNMSNITTIFNDGPLGASAARNRGIRDARGDIIAFIDDDAVAAPDWVDEMVKTYSEHNGIIGVAGAAEPLWEDPSMSWFPTEMYWLIGCSGWLDLPEKRETTQGATVNISYKRQAFVAAGLLSNSLGPQRSDGLTSPPWQDGSGEDNEFSRRVIRRTGKSLIFNPAAKVGHKIYKNRLALKWVARRSFATGWSRHMLERFSDGGSNDAGNENRRLLRQILFRLLPSILKRVFSDPVTAWRQLSLTVVALTFVGLGYVSFPFHNPFPKGQGPGDEGGLGAEKS